MNHKYIPILRLNTMLAKNHRGSPTVSSPRLTPHLLQRRQYYDGHSSDQATAKSSKPNGTDPWSFRWTLEHRVYNMAQFVLIFPKCFSAVIQILRQPLDQWYLVDRPFIGRSPWLGSPNRLRLHQTTVYSQVIFIFNQLFLIINYLLGWLVVRSDESR